MEFNFMFTDKHWTNSLLLICLWMIEFVKISYGRYVVHESEVVSSAASKCPFNACLLHARHGSSPVILRQFVDSVTAWPPDPLSAILCRANGYASGLNQGLASLHISAIVFAASDS
jgi:hypothetical protein